MFLLEPNSPNHPLFCLSYGLVLPYLWTSYNQKVSAILQRWHSLQIQCNYVGASRLEYGNDFFSLVLWFDFGIGEKYQDLSKIVVGCKSKKDNYHARRVNTSK